MSIKKRKYGLIANSLYRRRWKKLTAALSLIVVTAMLASLTLPAITATESDNISNIHVHTAECFVNSVNRVLSCSEDSVGVHSHGLSCYDSEGKVICGRADYVIHSHTSKCYSEDDALVCALSECEATADTELHTHTNACYTDGELACGKTELREHTHTAACFEISSVLGCGYGETPVSEYMPADDKGNAIPIDFYVLVDNEWKKIYSSYGLRHGVGKDIDSVELSELVVAYGGVYGFTGDESSTLEFVFEKKDSSDTNIYTTKGYTDVDGVTYVKLSSSENGYNIYHTPENTQEYGNNVLSMLNRLSPSFVAALGISVNAQAVAKVADLKALATQITGNHEVSLHYNGLNPDFDGVTCTIYNADGTVRAENITVGTDARYHLTHKFINDKNNSFITVAVPDGGGITFNGVRSVGYDTNSGGMQMPYGYIVYGEYYAHVAFPGTDTNTDDRTAGTYVANLQNSKNTTTIGISPADEIFPQAAQPDYSGDKNQTSGTTGVRMRTVLHALEKDDAFPGMDANLQIDVTNFKCLAMVNDEWVEVGRIFTSWNWYNDIGIPSEFADSVTDSSTSEAYSNWNNRDRVWVRTLQNIYEDFGFKGFANADDPANGIFAAAHAVDMFADGNAGAGIGWADTGYTCVQATNGRITLKVMGNYSGKNPHVLPNYEIFYIPGNYDHRITGSACIQDYKLLEKIEGDWPLGESRTTNGVNLTSYNEVIAHNVNMTDNANPGTWSNYFYTVTTADPEGLIDASLDGQVKIARKRQSITVTLPKGSGEYTWMPYYVNTGGLVNPEGRVWAVGGSGTERETSVQTAMEAYRFCDWTVTDNGDGTLTYTVNQINRALEFRPYNIALEKSVTAFTESVPVDYYIAVDGVLTWAGSTTLGDRNVTPPTTGNHIATSLTYDFVTAEQIETVLAPYGFTADDLVTGQFLFSGYNNNNTYNVNPSLRTAERAEYNGAAGIRLYSWINDEHSITCSNDSSVHSTTTGDTYCGQCTSHNGYFVVYMPECTYEVTLNKNISCTNTAYDVNVDVGKISSTVGGDSKLMYYTVNVVDGDNLVYSDEEQAAMQRGPFFYGTAGSEIEPYYLKNVANYAWGIAGVGTNNTLSDDGNTTYMMFTEPITRTWNITLAKLNPSFTVQYYGDVLNYDIRDTSYNVWGDSSVSSNIGNAFALIDSSNGLPTNKETLDSSSFNDYLALYCTLDGAQNTVGTTYTPIWNYEYTQLYLDETFEFEAVHGYASINKLNGAQGYSSLRIGVIEKPVSGASYSENDSRFTWYYFNDTEDNVYLTNTPGLQTNTSGSGNSGKTHTLYINDGALVRIEYLPYDSGTGNQYNVKANFYDYDILATNSTGNLYADGNAINDPHMYVSGSSLSTVKAYNKDGSPNDAGDNVEGVFMMGNAGNIPNGGTTACWYDSSCGTWVGLNRWNVNHITHTSSVSCSSGASCKGAHKIVRNNVGSAVFNLTSGYDPNTMNILWSNGVKAPANLFGSNTRKGKYITSGGTLGFRQHGDSYVLYSANAGTVNGTTMNSLSGLESFELHEVGGTPSNDFWAFDKSFGQFDPLFGAANERRIYGYSFAQGSNNVNFIFNKISSIFGDFENPQCDDKVFTAAGGKHNFYFGMNFSIDFTLTADYVAPMEYIFFGDDDLWVFLTDKRTGKQTKICDIGGVHQASGMYVDLRHYLPNGSAGDYTLTVYYLERGGSGSTCWMSFNLPEVTASEVGQETATAALSKTVIYPDGTDASMSEAEFDFTVHLRNAKGAYLNNTYGYMVFPTDEAAKPTTLLRTGTILKTGTIRLSHGERAYIRGLPVGAVVTVTENVPPGYTVAASTALHAPLFTNGVVSGFTVGESSASVHTNSQTVTLTQEDYAHVVDFTNTMRLELPNTGGIGKEVYIYSGLILLAVSAALLYINNKKRGGVSA